MSSPKDIRHFSEKWLEVFDWFEAHPEEEYRVWAETPTRARTIRFEFYRAREAMRKDEGLRGLYMNTDRREVSINGSTVIFRFKEKTSTAELLDKSLQQAKEGAK